MKACLSATIVCAALALASAGPALAAEASGDCSVPISLGEQPEMDEFADYSDFLVAIMGYKEKEEEEKEHRKSCPELYLTPPVVWDGPENLNDAVAEAGARPEFDYQANPTWYDKSTSRSFGLADMPASTLASELIQSSLANLTRDEEGLAEDEQAALLLLSAIGGGTEDGSDGAEVFLDFSDWLTFQRDLNAELATSALDSAQIGDLLVNLDGGLVVALSFDGSILFTDAYYEFESCLGSCDEFVVTVGVGQFP